MSHKVGYVVTASLLVLGILTFVPQTNAVAIPPGNVPGYGMGQLCNGQKGEFFITASGNNPYVSFHTQGNTTMMGVFRIQFEKLVFFTDSDQDGRLTGADTVTSQKILSTLAWTTGDLVVINGEYQIALNTSSPTYGDESFVFHFQNASSNDTSNQLKFDWVVTNMADAAYAGGDHVALQVQFFIDIKGQNNQQQMRFLNGTGTDNNSILCSPSNTAGDAQAKIAWVEGAKINGTEQAHACGGNGLDSSTGNTQVDVVNFAFPKFQNLSYDPTLEVQTPSGIPGFPAELVVFQVVLVGGLFAFILHRRLRRIE